MTQPAPVLELRGGRYAVLGVLGTGSQAETLDAVDKRDGRAVAIKRFQVRGAKSWKEIELAEREASVLSDLSHPNLPVYIEHFEEDGALYLVMQKIDGETLSALRKRRGSLSADDVRRFLSDADSALHYLHSRVPPIIHRDLKPGNVIRRPDGSFAFVDFGSVRDRLKPEGGSTVVGTFGYMAPEQFQGRALPASDVYAVGATLLTLITGQEPENLPHRGLALDVRRALDGGAPPWLERALSAMLEPDPDRRASRILPLLGDSATARGAESLHAEAQRLAQRAREEAEVLAQRAREEGRRVRDEARRYRHDARSERRSAHRLARGPRHFRPPFPLVALLLLGLTLARVGTWALFRVFLPTLLVLLSLFDNRLRRAARRMQQIGVRGERGLSAAIGALQGRVLDEAEARAEQPSARGRYRVDPLDADVVREPEDDDPHEDPHVDQDDFERQQRRKHRL